MKNPLLCIGAMAILALASIVHAQSLQPAWSFSLDITDPGSELDFIDSLNAGSDGSVGFVVGRTIGGGSPQNRIFWLRPKADGSSPTAPIWSSTWLPRADFVTILAIRRNHLVYSIGRDLKSVTLAEDGTPTESTVNFFRGTQGIDKIYFNLEQARSPGYFFAAVIGEDREGATADGFTLSAYRFQPAPPSISAVPTFTALSGESLSISFQTAQGVNYQLQCSETLTAASWLNVGEVIAGNGQLQTLIQQAGVPRKFFRVVAL